MESDKEIVRLGPGACEYAGVNRLVITAGGDGVIREGHSRVFVTDDEGVFWEWKLRDVLLEAGYVQCNIISPHPSKHTHGVTMFVFPASASVGPDQYEPADSPTQSIEAIPFQEH